MFIHTYDEKTEIGERWTVAAFSASSSEIREIKQWCYATYGQPGNRWCDTAYWGEVRFRDKKDLTMFLLRWR